jgi:hypothetical protein
MSLVLYPNGLRGGRGSTGADTVSEHMHNAIANPGATAAIYIGDPIQFSAGKVIPAATSVGGTIIAAFDAVFKGCQYDLAYPIDRRFVGSWPGNMAIKPGTEVWANFEGRTDKAQLFTIITDGPVSSAVVGQKANLNVGSGNINNGTSTVSLNVASVGTGTAVIIESVVEGPGSYLTDDVFHAPTPSVKLLVRNANVTA